MKHNYNEKRTNTFNDDAYQFYDHHNNVTCLRTTSTPHRPRISMVNRREHSLSQLLQLRQAEEDREAAIPPWH